MGTEDRWIGETIDRRYRIERRLGAGGMGVVYAAEHLGLSRRVAIKLLDTTRVEPSLLERFRREAKLASSIAHPNIVQVFDVGSERGIDFIAMELVDGRDLGALLADGPLAVDRAVALARQMLDALQVVHDAGIIHRDIKPSNVLVAAGDVVKLMDFGIARGLEDPGLTRTGHTVGTTEFMSPEQLRGGAVDHRADLYATGITLFAMIAGDLPFRGATAAVAGAQVFQPPPALAQLRPETPAHVVAAVERALAKAPGDRFADARAFAAALGGPADEPRTVALRPSNRGTAAAPAVPPAASRQWLLVVVAVVVGIGSALGVRRLMRGSGEVVASAPPPADARTLAADAPPARAVAVPADAPGAPLLAVDAAIARSLPPLAGSATVAPGRSGRCFCIPTDAPDLLPLCETKGPQLCRCDDGHTHSLCEEPLKLTCYGEMVYVASARSYVPKPGGDPCITQEGVCPYNAGKFHRAGELDAACSGYVTPWIGPRGTARPVDGHVDCDVCVGMELGAYLGHAGDACTGFYWRSGATRHGRLDFCH